MQRMTTPPTVITTKDLLYVKDAMSWQLIAMKKCKFYADQVKDPRVKQAIDKAGQIHQRHYQVLLGHTKNNNTHQMVEVQHIVQQNQQASQQQQQMQQTVQQRQQ